jgi:hypothetical protein
MPEDSNQLVSEVEQLKAELAAVRNRERELNAQLATRPSSSLPQEPPVKLEASDNFSLSSPARSSNVPSPNKSGASLGLMVCSNSVVPIHSLTYPASRSSYVPSLHSSPCLFRQLPRALVSPSPPPSYQWPPPLISIPIFPTIMIGRGQAPPPSWILIRICMPANIQISHQPADYNSCPKSMLSRLAPLAISTYLSTPPLQRTVRSV